MSRMSVKDAEKRRGCWLDGHRGWTASGELVNIAAHHGMKLDADDRAIVDAYLSSADTVTLPLEGRTVDADDIHEYVAGQGELAERAEHWLSRHVAPDGWSFGWHDGEFFLWPDSEWDDV
jgi:hypothetical protein